LLPQTTTRRALAPEDVLRNPGSWAEITKTEAVRIWRRTPVVLVIGPRGRETARWYSGVSRAPRDPSGPDVEIKYYRYAGPLPVLPQAKTWGAPPLENLDTAGAGGGEEETGGPTRVLGSEEEPKHFIEVELVFEDGTPVANEPYHIELPDGSISDRKLDGSGRVRFDEIDPGMARVQFPELDRHRAGTPTPGGGGGGGGGGGETPDKPPTPKVDEDKAVQLTEVSPQFAPGVENLDIKYAIKGLEGKAVTLKITSDQYPDQVLFERPLTEDEKKSGEKTITWDGKAGKGPLSGKHAGPIHSPYKVSLDAGAPARDEKPFKIEIAKIEITHTFPDKRLIMNDPEAKAAIVATVQLKKKDGSAAVTPVAMDVTFTFEDPAPANTAQASSFKYKTGPDKFLGKAGDAGAIHWEAHPDSAAASDDGFKTKCRAAVITAAGANQGKAKIMFKPSGVGGDSFKIKAAVLGADGSTELAKGETDTLEVWRRINFNSAYQVAGQTVIATQGTEAKMAGYYTAATFVEYKLGAIHAVAAKYSIKYIGLWDHAADAQKDWNVWKRKTAAETPTNDEKTKANGPAGPDRTAARAAVTAKAQAWGDRIYNAMIDGLNNWASDAGIPTGSVIAVNSAHPKYSANSGADATTTEWTDFAWLQINIEGTAVRPDRRWVESEGFDYAGRAYIMSGLSAARAQVVIAHEAGHNSKNHFKRADFGSGDHSAAAGLMDTTGSVSSFTAAEIKILRGKT
jgi:hypothetical protein